MPSGRTSARSAVAAFGIVALRDSGGLEYLVLGDVSVVIETADREVIALTDPSVARTSRPAMERFEGSLRRTRSHDVRAARSTRR